MFSGYSLSIDERNLFLADAKADIVRTGTDILRTGTDKMIFESRMIALEFSDFLQKFYLPDNGGGISNYKAKKKVPMFFFDNALDEGYDENIICPSDSTYEKWLTGTRKPDSAVWAELIHSFNDIQLQKALLASLSDTNLRNVMESFDIVFETGENPDKLLFAKAVVKQFKVIANGGGSAENIVPIEYKKPPEIKGFGAYIREAKRKFGAMKLPGEGESPLGEYFVCNHIGTSSAAFPNRVRGTYIEDATLPVLRNFDRRGETRNIILIGACGYGKTLMLQHLFLEAANHVQVTGLLPLFAELRNYLSEKGDLVDFLVETAQEFDRSFSREKMEDLLERGQAEILLDGLDEMDPKETNAFQRRLGELIHNYPNNQVVISSRQCSAISGVRGFTKLYIQPLDDDQIIALIDKLLKDEEDDTAKNTILSFMDAGKGYVKRNEFVATNPLLLTIMVRKYESFRDEGKRKIGFYETMYDALIKGHDEDKESFDRFFHSVSSSEEFTQVFREFCTLTYMEGIYIFDHRSFEKFYKKLKSKNELNNPRKFTLNAFEHDVCATACMMYEQESGIFYIDPGFQDYFFAEFYYFEDTDPTKEMGRALWNRKIDSFRNLDALKMFYEIAPEKVNVCIIQPYLENTFKGKEGAEAFLRFLANGFGDVKYTLFSKPLIDKYMNKPLKAEKFDFVPETNYTKNVIYGLICDILGIPNTFVIGSMDPEVKQDGATHFFVGFYDKVRNPEEPDAEEETWLRGMQHEVSHIGDSQYFQNLEYAPIPVKDNTGQEVCFGYRYIVDPMSLVDNPEKKESFIELCNTAKLDRLYERIKAYYEKLIELQKTNDFR